MEPVVWLILLVVLIIIEIITLGLSTIWFAGGGAGSLYRSSLSCTGTASGGPVPDRFYSAAGVHQTAGGQVLE